MVKDADRKEAHAAFRQAVNMAPGRLDKWLDTEKSKSVGYANGTNKTSSEGKEAVGHESGRKVVAIKRKKKADLTDDDFAHMKKVVGYVNRHTKQRPSGDITDTRWRYSLMNWGHDPKRP